MKDCYKKLTVYLEEIKNILNDNKITDVAKLQKDINAKMERVKILQSNLSYVEPLTKQNAELSEQLCRDKLPYLQRLQREYFIKYRIYRNRSKGINQKMNRMKQKGDN